MSTPSTRSPARPPTAAEQDKSRQTLEVGGFRVDAKNVGMVLGSAGAIAPTVFDQVQTHSWGPLIGTVLGWLGALLAGNMAKRRRE